MVDEKRLDELAEYYGSRDIGAETDDAELEHSPGDQVMIVSSMRLPKDLAEEARSRSGEPGLSAYAEDALSDRVARERLDELASWLQEAGGPVSDEELQRAREELRRARLGHGAVTDSESHGTEAV